MYYFFTLPNKEDGGGHHMRYGALFRVEGGEGVVQKDENCVM